MLEGEVVEAERVEFSFKQFLGFLSPQSRYPPGERALPWESQESLHLFHRKRRADPGHLLCGIGVAVGMILFVV